MINGQPLHWMEGDFGGIKAKQMNDAYELA